MQLRHGLRLQEGRRQGRRGDLRLLQRQGLRTFRGKSPASNGPAGSRAINPFNQEVGTMDMNLLVGGLIALIVIADVAYLIRKRRRGENCCGCTGCSGCGSCHGPSLVTIDQDEAGKGNRCTERSFRPHVLL